jgi:hypothetical protein
VNGAWSAALRASWSGLGPWPLSRAFRELGPAAVARVFAVVAPPVRLGSGRHAMPGRSPATERANR